MVPRALLSHPRCPRTPTVRGHQRRTRPSLHRGIAAEDDVPYAVQPPLDALGPLLDGQPQDAPDVAAPAPDPGARGSLAEVLGDGGLGAAIDELASAAERVRALVADVAVGAATVDQLSDLLAGLDAGRSAAVVLASRVEQHRLARRAHGLALESVLASHGVMTDPARRALVREARGLAALPGLARAAVDGTAGGAVVQAICAEVARVPAAERRRLDERIAAALGSGQLGPDGLIDAVRDAVDAALPRRTADERRRAVEGRFLALQPRLDGSLSGYLELDAESAAIVVEAVDTAAPPPSAGPDDLTRHALDDGEVVVPESWPRRRRGRQRADGLVRVCEDHLARGARDRGGGTAPAEAHLPAGQDEAGEGPAGEGVVRGSAGRCRCGGTTAQPATPPRARPRVLVLTDIAALTGHDELAGAARLLWSAVGRPPSLTPAAVRRLASDAQLRLILHDQGEVLGVSAPTTTIPVRVRAAVQARDQGCRWPGCRAPLRYTDLHHVVPRHDDGPTTVDNLVALCRRHHTCVTDGWWTLTMTPQGTVTVRRGRRGATEPAPVRRALPGP